MDRKNNTQSDGLSTLTTPSDFVLRWGNRKRLRCMKVQAKEGGTHGNENNTNAKSNDSRPGQRATARIDRRAARSDLNKDSRSNNNTTTETNNGYGNGYINLRQRPASPSHRNLRNPDSSIGMRGHSNGAVRGLTSPERGNKKSGHQNNSHHHHNKKNIHYSNDGGGSGGSGSSETTHDGRRGGSSPGGDTITNVWPPKFVIALTNKEKEEDFLAIKGSKLPQRPKKRAKIIQRTVNLVCPGTWLCDLTLERYEVREKKVSKKRPRGLKAMGNMDSESSE